jgi:hypothetical protein
MGKMLNTKRHQHGVFSCSACVSGRKACSADPPSCVSSERGVVTVVWSGKALRHSKIKRRGVCQPSVMRFAAARGRGDVVGKAHRPPPLEIREAGWVLATETPRLAFRAREGTGWCGVGRWSRGAQKTSNTKMHPSLGAFSCSIRSCNKLILVSSIIYII